MMSEKIKSAIETHIEKLKDLSPMQPNSWYLYQAKLQPTIKQMMIEEGVLHEVKVYHDYQSPCFGYKAENYLFSLWVDLSDSKNEGKDICSVYTLLLEEIGLDFTDLKTYAKGMFVLNSKSNKKVLLDEKILKQFGKEGYRYIYREPAKKGKELFTFQREMREPNKRRRYYEVIKAYGEDLLNGNIFDMIKIGITR